MLAYFSSFILSAKVAMGNRAATFREQWVALSGWENIMRVTDSIYKVIKLMENIAVAALLLTMMVTAFDVVMGIFKRPMVGAYDLAGIGSGIAIAFAVAIASWNKQHIMVDTFTQKLPARLQVVWQFILRIINLIGFAVISLYLFKLAVSLKESGEICNTISMLPLWPIAVLLGCGCVAQLLVSIADMVKIIGRRQA